MARVIIVSPGVLKLLLSSHGFLDQVRSCSSLFTNGGTDHYVHALPRLVIQKSHLDEQLIDEPCPFCYKFEEKPFDIYDVSSIKQFSVSIKQLKISDIDINYVLSFT